MAKLTKINQNCFFKLINGLLHYEKFMDARYRPHCKSFTQPSTLIIFTI